jgi:hypothetical protein
MQVESRGGIVETEAADLLDPAQPVQHGVAMQLEALRCLGG